MAPQPYSCHHCDQYLLHCLGALLSWYYDPYPYHWVWFAIYYLFWVRALSFFVTVEMIYVPGRRAAVFIEISKLTTG